MAKITPREFGLQMKLGRQQYAAVVDILIEFLDIEDDSDNGLVAAIERLVNRVAENEFENVIDAALWLAGELTDMQIVHGDG
jgi:hypothetical protein